MRPLGNLLSTSFGFLSRNGKRGERPLSVRKFLAPLHVIVPIMAMLFLSSPVAFSQSSKTDPGHNDPPPAGAILDLAQISNGGNAIPGGGNATYQLYTANFTATSTGTVITFAFRDDPAQISFAYPSVVDTSVEEGGNLLQNGDFSQGLTGWTYANAFEVQAGGFATSGSHACYTAAYCWFDGAVQGFDAISQTITTIVGHNYKITFLVAEDSAIVAYQGNECCGYPPNFPGSNCWAATKMGYSGSPCVFSDVSTNGDAIDPGGNGIDVAAYAGPVLIGEQTGQTMQPGSSQGLVQSFPFANNNAIFDFDFTTAFGGDPLQVVANTTPTISLQGITQATYAAMVAGTSQATTQCLVAPGLGTDSNNNPLCAQFTITCTNANSNTPMGDNCPQDPNARDLLIHEQLQISGDALIPAGTAPSLAEGSDTWSPGNCTLVGPEAGNLCPQSELTQLIVTSTDCACKGGGTGTTLNSSFVFGTGQPEWNTLPIVPAWSNATTVPVSFTAYPPTPTAPTNSWVASPNKSITFGEENLGATPDTTFPVTGDQTMTNQTACPSAWPLPGTVPPSFTASGDVTVGGAGLYEVHFFSTACDNQQELAFPVTVGSTSPLNQNLATFKTVSFGVDQTAPTITTPVLSGGIGNNTFAPGSNLTASFSCTDDRSGLAGCGKNALPLPPNNAPVLTGQPVGTLRTGPTAGLLSQNVTNYTQTVSGSGQQTLTVYATDLACNQSSASARYCVGYNVVSVDSSGIVGFTSPVLNPGSGALPNINSASVNQAIPMSLTVTDCNGNPVTNLNLTSSGGTVVLSAANANICKIDTSDNSISTSAAGNSGWQNLGGGSYQYNWKPQPPHGSCLSFSVNLGDGIQHTAYFQFK